MYLCQKRMVVDSILICSTVTCMVFFDCVVWQLPIATPITILTFLGKFVFVYYEKRKFLKNILHREKLGGKPNSIVEKYTKELKYLVANLYGERLGLESGYVYSDPNNFAMFYISSGTIVAYRAAYVQYSIWNEVWYIFSYVGFSDYTSYQVASVEEVVRILNEHFDGVGE